MAKKSTGMTKKGLNKSQLVRFTDPTTGVRLWKYKGVNYYSLRDIHNNKPYSNP